ncbi:tetratricopeptide repeat-containing sulfotransferase family protein [Arenimonas terrae]|uniref:Sulfotransferase family protein n=1 Tax=Arenimonas terrae TaxID=2546226 RepID=A0A5C4RX67_9GAMM|nr:sulfotransferase [Arenimonas terrae]TNJ35674.1 sulfotransferase family protein [Arenimonas terrae]
MDDEDLRRQGNALAARRDWAGAAACFQTLAARRPDEAAAWIALAKARDLAGRPRAARAAARAAYSAFIASPASWTHSLALARLLRNAHELPLLRGLAAQLPARAVDASVPELVELADLLAREDAHEDALPWLDRALARDPSHAPAWYLRGTTRLFQGRMAAARADLERAVAIAPHFAHAHWRLSELRAGDRAGAPARVARLQAERVRVAPGSEHDMHFSYALHAELHDLGDHTAAWEALVRGARAKRATLRYDPDTDRRLFEAIRRTCGAALLSGAGHDDASAPVPVFIVGLFRSGTTVLERLLAGHPDVADGGESLGFTASLRVAVDHRAPAGLDEETLRRCIDIDWPALGADFMAGSAWRARGRRVWTEKLPTNFLALGLIARALPRARFIHMWRPPMDVCFSNLRQLYGGIAPYSYDQAELAAYHRGYRGLMAHWRAHLGDRLLDVAHADLVRDPETTARRVLAHCGLDYDPRVLAIGERGGSVSTASAAQVREGLRAPRAPDWEPYREQLAPLAAALAAAEGERG